MSVNQSTRRRVRSSTVNWHHHAVTNHPDAPHPSPNKTTPTPPTRLTADSRGWFSGRGRLSAAGSVSLSKAFSVARGLWKEPKDESHGGRRVKHLQDLWSPIHKLSLESGPHQGLYHDRRHTFCYLTQVWSPFLSPWELRRLIADRSGSLVADAHSRLASMSESLAKLHAMSDDDLVARHDEHTAVGTQHHVDELNRPCLETSVRHEARGGIPCGAGTDSKGGRWV
jgi:hypothetical protein